MLYQGGKGGLYRVCDFSTDGTQAKDSHLSCINCTSYLVSALHRLPSNMFFNGLLICLLHGGTLRCDHAHQLVPGSGESLCSFFLEPMARASTIPAPGELL